MPVGAAIGTAAASIGGGLLASKSQSKAAKDAANISSEDNAQNRAFLTDIYNRNSGYLSPWMQSGQQANNAYMQLLGFPAQQQQPQPQQQPSAFGPMPANGFNGGSAFAGMGQFGQQGMGAAPNDMYFGGGPFGQGQAQASPWGFSMPGGMQAPGAVTAPAPAAPNPRAAFDTYRGSTGYDFRFKEGTRALQSAFSRNLESGAASKSAIRFGQGIGSDEFGKYMQLLGDQSRLGLGGASALAGVGQTFGANVAAGNTAAANAAAGARLYAGHSAAQNWANMGSSFGNALGMIKW